MARKRSNRRTAEIYFVLYLSALIMILPNKRDLVHDGSPGRFVSDMPFNIYAEKSNLNVRYLCDSVGNAKLVSADTVNNLFFSGDVSDVRYDFMIFDADYRHKLHLDKNAETRYFKVTENTGNHSVGFEWKPQMIDMETKSYIVKVTATAKPKTDREVKGIIYQATTQFSLNLIVNDKINVAGMRGGTGMGTASPDSALSVWEQFNYALDSLRKSSSSNNNSYYVYGGDYDLAPERGKISQVSLQKWVNRINVYGINLSKDLKDAPQIYVSGSAAQRYQDVNIDVSDDKITLSGITPPAGRLTVKVQIVRRSDMKAKSISFAVMPIPLESPSYSSTMYVGKSYEINPQLPMIDRETRADIKLGQTSVAGSPQGTKFIFTPNRNMIGKTLRLERYIDGVEIQEENNIYIADIPSPEILSVKQISDHEVQVKVKSFGYASGGRNLVTGFSIAGNATYRELFGRIDESKDGFTNYQTFIFTRKRNDRAFEFSITATDKNGKTSSEKSYPN